MFIQKVNISTWGQRQSFGPPSSNKPQLWWKHICPELHCEAKNSWRVWAQRRIRGAVWCHLLILGGKPHAQPSDCFWFYHTEKGNKKKVFSFVFYNDKMGKCTFKFVFIHVFLSFFWQPCHSIQLPTDLKQNRGLCGLSLCMLLLPVLSSAGRWRRKTSQVWALLVPKWWWPKPVWSPWIARAGGRRCSAAPPGNQGASSEDAPSPRKTWWRRRTRTVRPGEGGQRQQGVELQEEQEEESQ